MCRALAPPTFRRARRRRLNMSAFATPMAPASFIFRAPIHVCGLAAGARRAARLRSLLQHRRPALLRQRHFAPWRGLRAVAKRIFQCPLARCDLTSPPWAVLNSTPGPSRPGAPCGRSFALTLFYGSNGSAALGSLGQQLNTFNTTAGTSASRTTTALNKAFLQFAGLTAGQAQSMFDFYADAYNYRNLRGSNATVALLAYTATFGDGFSATLSAEDQADRRAAIGSTIASTTEAPITVGGISATSFQAQPGGSRVPEIVGNVRLDQPWGAAQLSAAAHQVDSSLFAASALTTPPTASAFPALTSNSFGFAVQGGLQLNTDYISPGDKLWLQVAYEKGAFGYIAGNNLGFNYGSVNQNRFSGWRFTPLAITATAGTRRSIPTAFSPAAAPANSNRAGTSPAPTSIIGSRS